MAKLSTWSLSPFSLLSEFVRSCFQTYLLLLINSKTKTCNMDIIYLPNLIAISKRTLMIQNTDFELFLRFCIA